MTQFKVGQVVQRRANALYGRVTSIASDGNAWVLLGGPEFHLGQSDVNHIPNTDDEVQVKPLDKVGKVLKVIISEDRKDVYFDVSFSDGDRSIFRRDQVGLNITPEEKLRRRKAVNYGQASKTDFGSKSRLVDLVRTAYLTLCAEAGVDTQDWTFS